MRGAKGNIVQSAEITPDGAGQLWLKRLRRLRNHLYERDVEPVRAQLLRYCKRLTGDAASAEDLLQTTLLRGFDAFCQICGGPVDVKAYLFKIAANLHIDQTRKQRGLLALRQQLADSQIPSRSRCEVLETLMSLSHTLPPRELEVFHLHEIEGYSAADSASMLGTSAAAVKMAASRARRRLQLSAHTSG